MHHCCPGHITLALEACEFAIQKVQICLILLKFSKTLLEVIWGRFASRSRRTGEGGGQGEAAQGDPEVRHVRGDPGLRPT